MVRRVGNKKLANALRTEFDRLPPEMVVRAFGVDYGHVCPPEGGDLFVTRFGWPFLEQLLPGTWYTDQRYAKEGEKLPGSTGHAYHVVTKPADGVSLELVVKFSRVAQDVPLIVETTFPDDTPPAVIAEARFNSPMEEFGLVMELRNAASGPEPRRMLTQRPLGIYAPPQEFKLWQLGRNTSSFRTHEHLLAEDQEDAIKAIELDIKRMYVLLYGWIKGKDAQDSFVAGDITEKEFLSLAPRVIRELENRGYRVLDNKPRHYILRKRQSDGQVMRHRDGPLVYGLVDFELLQRTREHQRQFRARQREKYWRLQSGAVSEPAVRLPSHLKRMPILGVEYLYGQAPDGGRLWVLGQDPELFDYFLPERWRRTPRIKLSPMAEVYRTCTRDNIHVVYRRSRVGVRPRVDPLAERGNAIREHGYNSPFEEVAIAERLRQTGMSTTHPRAIFRTGHRSMKATHLRDSGRFTDHANLVTPDTVPEAVLAPDYDYYTIWGYFRGIDPARAQGEKATGVVDLERALEDDLLTPKQYQKIEKRTLDRLRAIGLGGDELDGREFVLFPDERGGIRRDTEGEVVVLTSIDALTAYDYGLLDEASYREIVERTSARLREVDCALLDPSGKHLLLSMDPDGTFIVDETGHAAVTLCNFELLQGPGGAIL